MIAAFITVTLCWLAAVVCALILHRDNRTLRKVAQDAVDIAESRHNQLRMMLAALDHAGVEIQFSSTEIAVDRTRMH